ncbi:MAG: carboxymuconolactone decarboxylase family protein [Sandaracinaceae bacterium]|nr:carboxymuconolactone decarboxylase family protein [Sandaracinaceae bacterium]
MTYVRIAAASPPWAPDVEEDLAKLMPAGMAPIGLFRTLAKNPRVLRRIRRAGLLDPGSVTIRQREIVILRTTALAGAEYEWGVHAAFFGGAAGLGARELHATVWLGPDADCWSAEEQALVRLADELHASARVSDPTWEALRSSLAEDAMIELLALAGFYRAVSYVVNGTGVPLEPAAPRFPAPQG